MFQRRFWVAFGTIALKTAFLCQGAEDTDIDEAIESRQYDRHDQSLQNCPTSWFSELTNNPEEYHGKT